MKKTALLILFVMLFANIQPVFAQSNGTVKIIKASSLNNTVSLSVYMPQQEDYITIMVCGINDDGSYNKDDIVYIEQQDKPVTDSKGRFILSFRLASWAESQKTYMIRIGGSSIDTPAELILNEDSFFYGDVDGDRKITAEDSQLIINYVLDKNKNPLTEEQLLRAEVTADDEITSEDAAYVLKKSLNPKFIFAEQ